MDTFRLSRIACVAVCAIVGLFSSATGARAQADRVPPSEAEAVAIAVKASPELVNGLAKELGSTPEQAAGAAGVMFTLAKSLIKPEDFAAMSKGVPGMDALLAATPASFAGTFAGSAAPKPSMLTPGFASSSSPTTGTTTAAANGTASAVAGISNLGINPEMIAKALPFLSGFLKKYGGSALGSLFESLFKGAGTPAK